MKKAGQKGFAPVETVLVLIIIGIIAFTVWYLFTSKSNTDNAYDNTAANQNQLLSNKKSTAKPEPKSLNGTSVILTANSDKYGKYITDMKNKPLYTYDNDTKGVSNCTASCLDTWPIYDAAGYTDTPPANLTVIKRSDGKSQFAYKGMPLYYFTGDTHGITGNGLDGFQLATP